MDSMQFLHGQQLLANSQHPVTNCDLAVESLKGILTRPFRSPLLHTDACFRRPSAPALKVGENQTIWSPFWHMAVVKFLI